MPRRIGDRDKSYTRSNILLVDIGEMQRKKTRNVYVIQTICTSKKRKYK